MVIDIKEERVKAGFTQKQLSERAGMDRAALARIENGMVEPQARSIYKIRKALGFINPEPDATSNRKKYIDVMCLDTSAIIQYDDKCFGSISGGGWRLARMKLRTKNNAPKFEKNDMVYVDMDRTDPREDAYYLLEFPVGKVLCYSAQHVLNDEEVYLSYHNANAPNLGIMNIAKFRTIGRLVHLGRAFVDWNVSTEG